MSVSQFYYACRNGDVAEVEALLTSMSITEIDRMEPNGSTALHAAAYYGQIGVVRLLLEEGASRSQKNKYDKTAEEEAKTPEIVQLFQDIKVKLDIGWSISNAFTAASYHRRFYSFTQGPPTLSYVVEKLLNAEELCNIEGTERFQMNPVWQLFNKSIESNDAAHLICAYTMLSPFYRILNKTLVSHNELTNEERENPPWFCAYVRFLASDEPTLRSYRWTGTTYRGIRIPKNYKAQLQVGKMLMNKGFLSTSKLRKIAIAFTHQKPGIDKRYAIFICIVNDDRAALDIKEISYSPAEDEVLILPCMDFEITKINDCADFVEITLLLR